MKLRPTLAIAILVTLALGPLATQLAAQTAELPRHTEAYSWSSGSHNGNGGPTTDPAALVTRDVLEIPGAPWMQLVFGNRQLGKKSRVEITSLLDGATQVLDAVTLEQWNGRSAYFNGDAVEVRLYVGPQAKGTSIRVSEVVVGDRALGRKSICGVDNRVASSEARVGRIDPIGCTGWNIDNGKNLTAGHCLASSGNTTLSFNVPPSLSDGTVQFPGPEDQYSINQGSFQYTNGGVGNDWGIFSVYDNSVTGLQPIEAQGAFAFKQDLNPTNIRITGFGVDSGTTNQTNQTHVGPNAGSSGTTMRYATDTQGGNSGSPVIDEATGQAVGIHTHGGCTSSGGNNSGTSFFHSALWTAVNAGGGGGGGGNELQNGVPETGLSASTGGELRYTLDVPAGVTDLLFTTTGSDPDADLYVQFGSAPTTSSFDCRSWSSSSNETCNIGTAQAGTYHVLVYAYSSFTGLTLTGSYTDPGGGGGACNVFFKDWDDGNSSGWSNSGTCSTGAFVLGSPTQQTSTVVTQPGGCSTGSYCMFTATNSSAGVNDVDGGNCILTSSTLATVASGDSIDVAYFHGQRDTGDDASGDFFRLEYRCGTGSWTSLQSIGDTRTTASWSTASGTVNCSGGLSLRVQASDGSGPGDIVEGGIDEICISR